MSALDSFVAGALRDKVVNNLLLEENEAVRQQKEEQLLVEVVWHKETDGRTKKVIARQRFDQGSAAANPNHWELRLEQQTNERFPLGDLENVTIRAGGPRGGHVMMSFAKDTYQSFMAAYFDGREHHNAAYQDFQCFFPDYHTWVTLNVGPLERDIVEAFRMSHADIDLLNDLPPTATVAITKIAPVIEHMGPWLRTMHIDFE